MKARNRFYPGDTVTATEVSNCPLQYGKKYKVRKENNDDKFFSLHKDSPSKGEYVYLEGINGGWYPNRFKLVPEDLLSKEKETGRPGKPRRMLRI